MKKIFIFLLVAFIATAATAQNTISWQKNMGGTNTEYANGIDTCVDGSMLAVGSIRSTVGEYVMQYFNPADNLATDAWIVKYNKYGVLQWQKVFGGTGTDEFFDVKTTADGGAIAVGRSYSLDGNITDNKGGEDIIVAKYDAAGNLEWNKNYGSSLLDGARSIIVMPDGSYVLNCYSNGNDKDFVGGKGLRDIWLMQLSSTGSIIRKKNFGGSNSDEAFDLLQYAANRWVFVAQTGSLNGDITGSHGNNEVWVVKLDSAWNFINRKCFGGPGQEGGNSIVALPGGFLVVANANQNGGEVSGIKGSYDTWVIKTDTSLNGVWFKTYGGTQNDQSAKAVLMPDFKVLIGGQTSSTDGDITSNAGLSDAWLLKIDTANGNVVSSITCGDAKADFCRDVLVWGNNDFLFSGSLAVAVTSPTPHTQLWMATSKQLPAPGPLPLTLVSFEGRMDNKINILEWVTANEVNVKAFTLEKGIDGNHFETVKTIAAFNVAQGAKYNGIDPLPFNGNNYYRLKMTDIDGRFSYSPIVIIKNKSHVEVAIGPVPATNILNIYLTGNTSRGRLTLCDMNGKVIIEKLLQSGSTKEQLVISNLPAGNYFVRVTIEEEVFTKVFTKP